MALTKVLHCECGRHFPLCGSWCNAPHTKSCEPCCPHRRLKPHRPKLAITCKHIEQVCSNCSLEGKRYCSAKCPRRDTKEKGVEIYGYDTIEYRFVGECTPHVWYIIEIANTMKRLAATKPGISTTIYGLFCNECGIPIHIYGLDVQDRYNHRANCVSVSRCIYCSAMVCYSHDRNCPYTKRCDECNSIATLDRETLYHDLNCSQVLYCFKCHTGIVKDGICTGAYCGISKCKLCNYHLLPNNQEHAYTCPTRRCIHCGSLHESARHPSNCPTVPKCTECGGRSDRSTRYHKSSCTIGGIPRCESCGIRTDTGKACQHRRGCTLKLKAFNCKHYDISSQSLLSTFLGTKL